MTTFKEALDALQRSANVANENSGFGADLACYYAAMMRDAPLSAPNRHYRLFLVCLDGEWRHHSTRRTK